MPTTSSNYQVAWGRLFPQLLPVLLRRGPRLRSWLAALLSPLTEESYPGFLALVARARRELTYNGQTMILEKALNDYFDPSRRRIEVVNDDLEVLPQYLFYKREGQQLPDLFFRSELPHVTNLALTYQVEQRAAGFTVYAPTLQRFDKKLKAKIERLKLAMTTYRVLFVPAPPH